MSCDRRRRQVSGFPCSMIPCVLARGILVLLSGLSGLATSGALAFSLAWLPVAHASAQGEPSASDRQASLVFNTASRLYRQENWRDAAAAFGQFLERYPRHADALEARFARGYCFNRLGDHAAAIADLRLAGRDPARRWAGDANFFLGRSLEAIAQKAAEASAARRKGFRDAAASYAVAAAIRRDALGTLERSAKPAERSSRTDAYVQALASQGEAFYHGGALSEAVDVLAILPKDSKSLSRSPAYARGVYFLSLSSYALDGKKDRADFATTLASLEWLSGRGREGQPFWAEAAYLQARILHRQSSWSAAIALYSRLLEQRAESSADAMYYRGLAYYELGAKQPSGRGATSLAKAATELASFRRDHPEHSQSVKARYYEALAHFHLGDYARATPLLSSFATEVVNGPHAQTLIPQVWLSLGQSLLLQKDRDAAAASTALGRCSSIIRTRLQKGDGDPGLGAKLAKSQYWRGEALFLWATDSAEGEDSVARLVEASKCFLEVAGALGKPVPQLAEEAVYKAADALLRAGRHAECAQIAARYRSSYATVGRFRVEVLALAGRNALEAPDGTITTAERRAAPSYFGEASKLAREAAQKRRYQYLSGVAHYYNDDFALAIDALGGVYGAIIDDPKVREEASYDEIAFFLADSFAQKFRATGLRRIPDGDTKARTELLDAAALFGEYLDRVRKTPGRAAARHVATARVNQGLCFQWAGDLTSARKSYAAFLKEHAGHQLETRIRFSLAGVCLDLDDESAALEEYRRVALGKSSEGDLAARAGLQAASLERRSERPSAALPLLDGALARIGQLGATDAARRLETDARFQRAMALVELDQAVKARAALESFLKTFPASSYESDARLQLAYLCLDAGDSDTALATVAPICEAQEDVAGRDEALYLRAWALGSLAVSAEEAADDAGKARAAKLHERMESTYRRLIAQFPDSDYSQDATLELGQHLFNRGDHTEAKQWFSALRKKLETAVGSARGDAGRRGDLLERSLYGLAFVSFEEKDYANARTLFDAVARRDESDLAPRATFQAARSWMLSKGEKQAVERFRRMIGELKPRAAEFYDESLLRLGECHHRLQEYSVAVQVFERLLKESPKGALRHDARFGLGLALQYQDKPKEAVAAFRKVVADNPGVVGARAQYHVGECLMDQKRYREAAREFLVVVANFDFDGGYRDWFRRSLLSAGLSYEADGDRKAARQQWKELIDRFPDSPEAKAAKARMSN